MEALTCLNTFQKKILQFTEAEKKKYEQIKLVGSRYTERDHRGLFHLLIISRLTHLFDRFLSVAKLSALPSLEEEQQIYRFLRFRTPSIRLWVLEKLLTNVAEMVIDYLGSDDLNIADLNVDDSSNEYRLQDDAKETVNAMLPASPKELASDGLLEDMQFCMLITNINKRALRSIE